jgi:hypothetical protein
VASMRAMARRRLLTLLALCVAALATSAPAHARAVPMRVDATASCTPKSVFVRFDDGQVRRVQHVQPGATIRKVTSRTRNLFLVLHVDRTWAQVKGGNGTTFKVTAEGPRGERWRWQFRVQSRNPEDDSSNYMVCFRPMAGETSFLRVMRGNKGSWLFSAQVVKGRYVGSRDGVRLAVSS